MATIDIKLPEALQERLSMPSCASFSLRKPELPELTLPTGGTIKALADITKGVPTDCSLNFNLMLQLAPILASMECLFDVLKLLGALKKFFDAAAKGVVEVPGAAVEVVKAFEGVAKCIGFPFGTGAFLFVRDLLRLIGTILRCLGQQLKSIAALMGGLTLQIRQAEAAGNAELMQALGCARDNARNSAEGALMAIEPITLVLGMAEPFMGVAGVSPVKLPAIGSLEDAESMNETGDALLAASAALLAIADGISPPGGG
jgi:hypothetical protein